MSLASPYTFGVFKTIVAQFLNREAQYLEQTAPIVTQAINNAKRFIERQFDFEYQKDTCMVTLDLNLGGALTSNVPVDANGNPIDGASAFDIKSVYGADLPGGVLGFLPPSTTPTYIPIEVKSEEYHIEQLKRRTPATLFSGFWEQPEWLAYRDTYGSMYLWRRNQSLFVYPNRHLPNNITTLPVFLKVIKWSQLYVNDSDTDFMLQYCPDYLMYRSIRELNYFLKEDSRVQIANSVMQEAFQSLVSWDASLKNNGDDWNLE